MAEARKIRKRAPKPARSISELGRRLRDGCGSECEPLSAHFPISDIETRDDDGARSYTFTISTGIIDRDRDIINVAGWKTDAFMAAGGPVLYGHGFDANGTLPIGKATRVWTTARALKAEMRFIPGDPYAERVRRAVDFGALRATSVGFRPLPGKAAWNEERGGVDFQEQELLEFSIVPIPANPQAIREKRLTVPTAIEYLSNADVADAAVKLALALGKRGRVLSTANEERIRSAYGHGEQLCEALGAVLEQVDAMQEDDEMRAAPIVLRLAPDVPRLKVRAEDVCGATRRALADIVAATIRRHTGRLD